MQMGRAVGVTSQLSQQLADRTVIGDRIIFRFHRAEPVTPVRPGAKHAAQVEIRLNALLLNVIKPFVIGRKAWLFANTRTGATGSAVLYSMVETAKINGLEPYKYLTELFEKLPTANTPADLAKLLPY